MHVIMGGIESRGSVFQLETVMKSRLKNQKIPVLVRRRKDRGLLEVIDVPCAEVSPSACSGGRMHE